MTDYAARIRAARAYAGIHQTTLAERIGVDVQTIKRREKGEGPYRSAELIAIATACHVPPEFMEEGFGGIGADELAERLRCIEDALTTDGAVRAVTELRDYIRTSLEGRALIDKLLAGRLATIETDQRAIRAASLRLLEVAEELLPADSDLRDRAAQAGESVSPSPEVNTTESGPQPPATDRPAQDG